MQQFGIQFNTLTVVHDEVADSAGEIYHHLVELGATYIQFQPLMAEGAALQQKFSLTGKNWGKFLVSVYRQWQSMNHIGNVFVINIEQVFSQYFTQVSPTCVHSGRCGTNLMMGANGDIYACDHPISAANFLGNFNTLNQFSTLVAASMQLPFGRKKSMRLECQRCSVKPVCQGGCPAHLNHYGENQLCEGYYHFFSEVLSSLNTYERNPSGLQIWRKDVLQKM